MKAPKALLIDLDDTLLNYDGYSQQAWHEACEAVSVDSVPADVLVDEIIRYAGWYWSDAERHRAGRNNLEETRRLMVREALKNLGRPDDRIANEIGDRYIAIREEKLQLFPGTRETLERLKRKGMPMCLVTNGEARLQRRKIERFHLEPYFKGILIEGELGFGKPDERVFKLALEILGTAAQDTWMIGDNYEWEVIAPRELGMSTIWVDRHGNGLPAGVPARPDAVIAVFSELLEVIEAAGADG
ncbi:MAG: HAD family hydrolase [Spirochaetales bacterium]|nr:HAD family hydrolase [Spirochaetales bacterium]